MKIGTKQDIRSIEDIRLLVDSFYSKVVKHDLLGPVFSSKIKDHQWPDHLNKMYRFWQTLLLEDHTYFGNPLMHHLNLPVTEHHFSEWLRLFRETIDEHFTGEKATEANLRAEKIAVVFLSKISQFGLTQEQ